MTTHAVVRRNHYRRGTAIGVGSFVHNRGTVFALIDHEPPGSDSGANTDYDSYGSFCQADPPGRVAWLPIDEVDCPTCAAEVARVMLARDR